MATPTTNCHGGCGAALQLEGCDPAAIFICRTCRRDEDKLNSSRRAMNRRLREVKAEMRKTNLWWPFVDFNEAWAHA